MKLPWKVKYENIPYNFVLARNRLLSLLKHLSKNPKKLKRYDITITNQGKDGIIESVDNREVIRHGEVHYIPHKEAIREERETTKLLTVYDASANQNGPSFNETLHSGPSLLSKIFDIFVQLRSYRYAILSDMCSLHS